MDVEKELTKEPKAVSPLPSRIEPECGEARVDEAPSSVRYASDEQFRKAQRKTSAQHAGLFRRLAK
jgi:hypothetical protein